MLRPGNVITNSHNGTSTGSSRVGCPANNVLAGKEPVAPAKAANVVERLEEKHRCLGVFDGVFLYTNFFGLLADVGQELAVGTGAVRAELMEDLGQGGLGHGDLAEVVEERNLDWLVGM